jgi:hypothetical protein
MARPFFFASSSLPHLLAPAISICRFQRTPLSFPPSIRYLLTKRHHNAILSSYPFSRRGCPSCPRDRLRACFIMSLAISWAHFLSKVTDPIATSSLPAGQPATIKWQDDGTAPSLAQFGLSSIGLYVGSPTQQVCSLFHSSFSLC